MSLPDRYIDSVRKAKNIATGEVVELEIRQPLYHVYSAAYGEGWMPGITRVRVKGGGELSKCTDSPNQFVDVFSWPQQVYEVIE